MSNLPPLAITSVDPERRMDSRFLHCKWPKPQALRLKEDQKGIDLHLELEFVCETGGSGEVTAQPIAQYSSLLLPTP
jgi:hypothetical protein